ncbi:hypothetical protein M758_4G078000 [Ceratodon purpureus]|nr:hypothetical protein M758_4G078000 [Ceratodon purpureus]
MMSDTIRPVKSNRRFWRPLHVVRLIGHQALESFEFNIPTTYSDRIEKHHHNVSMNPSSSYLITLLPKSPNAEKCHSKLHNHNTLQPLRRNTQLNAFNRIPNRCNAAITLLQSQTPSKTHLACQYPVESEFEF